MKSIGEIEKFYKLIKYKYPVIHNGTRIHICPEENIIFNCVKRFDYLQLNKIYIDTLNSSELLILSECNGKRCTLDILGDLRRNHGFKCSELKILVKLMKLYNNIFIDFKDRKDQYGNFFELTGTTEYFIPIYMVFKLDYNIIKQKGVLEIKDVIKNINEKGCKFIEVVGKNILPNRVLNKLFKFIIDEFDLLILRIENFSFDKNLMKLFEGNKEKIIWCANSFKNSSKYKDLKEEIRITNILKRGNNVVFKDSNFALELEDINVTYFKESFKENRYNYDKVYLNSECEIEIKKFNEPHKNVNENSNSVEDMLLKRYLATNSNSISEIF